MLNWIALALEFLGFSIAAIEVFFPNIADKVEDLVDAIVKLELVKQLLFSAISYTLMGIILIEVIFPITESIPRSSGINVLILVLAGAALAAIVELLANWLKFDFDGPLGFHLPTVFLALVYIPLAGFIAFSNKIHPSDRALGGAGLIIAFCGLLIDFSQVIFSG